jgi:hypothetical protein
MNGNGLKNSLFSALLVLAGLAAGCSVGSQPASVAADTSASSQQLPFVEGKTPVVPANTAIYVRLQQPISSVTAQSGQNFSAVLDEPLAVDGQTLAPTGAVVTGMVVAARESGHFNGAGYLRITLTSILLNGKNVPMQTNSMYVSGGSYKKRNLAFVGGGASGSPLLGALVGGDKNAVVSSAPGTTGGTSAVYATGKKEVGFVADHQLGFRLTQPLNIN